MASPRSCRTRRSRSGAGRGRLPTCVTRILRSLPITARYLSPEVASPSAACICWIIMDAVRPFLGWLQEHLLPVVFVTSLIDATGLPFPGRAMLVAAGIAAGGPRDVVLLVLTGVTGALLGDHLLYALGMRRGPRLLALYCRRSLGSVRCVENTLAYFRRFGAFAVLIGRFSTSVRLFGAVLAGTGEIGYRRFLLLDLVGSIVYMTLWIVLGATVGAVALERVGRPLQAVLLLGPIALVAILLYRLFRRWRYGAASRDLIEFTGEFLYGGKLSSGSSLLLPAPSSRLSGKRDLFPARQLSLHSRCSARRTGGDDYEDTSEHLSCWARHAVRVAGHGRSRLAPDHLLGAGQHSGKHSGRRTLRLPCLPLRRGPARAGRRRGEAVRHEAEVRGRRRGSPVPTLRRAPHRPFLRGPAHHADRARAVLAQGPRRDPAHGYRAVALDSRGGP